MGFITDLFDADARKRNRVSSLTKKLQAKYGQSEDRNAAADVLADMKTDEAWRGLVKRFSVTVDNHTHDQDEKQHVSDLLLEIGAPVLPILQEYLARDKEVSWALRTLRRMVGLEKWVDIVLATIDGKTSEDTDSDKLVQILRELHDQKDTRVPIAVARFLEDLDDTVRFAAIETLSTIDAEESRAPMLAALTKPDEESQRVRHRILELFRDRGWEVKGFRKAVEDRLPEGWYLDREGHIKQLAAGAKSPPVDE